MSPPLYFMLVQVSPAKKPKLSGIPKLSSSLSSPDDLIFVATVLYKHTGQEGQRHSVRVQYSIQYREAGRKAVNSFRREEEGQNFALQLYRVIFPYIQGIGRQYCGLHTHSVTYQRRRHISDIAYEFKANLVELARFYCHESLHYLCTKKANSKDTFKSYPQYGIAKHYHSAAVRNMLQYTLQNRCLYHSFSVCKSVRTHRIERRLTY